MKDMALAAYLYLTRDQRYAIDAAGWVLLLSLIHISEPTRPY